MNGLTTLFVAALLAATATRIWLASRQITAVRAHRNRVPEYFEGQIEIKDQQKASDYTAARASFMRVAAVLDSLLRLALTLGGGIALADALWRRAGLAEPWHGAVVIGTVVLASVLVSAAIAAWRTFVLETRFGFNRATPALFAADVVKRLLLGAALGAPVVFAALWLMAAGGRAWWLFAWLGWTAYSLSLTWAFPRFVSPLFNRFTPLPDGELRTRVEALVARCGFESRGVFVMDGSRRTAHGNAYFTGLGRNKRIVFLDTLLDRLDGAEVEAVLAHELGHFRLKHVRQRFVASLLVSLGALAALGWAANEPGLYSALGVPSPSPYAALLLAVFASPPFWFFVTPLRAWWSRRHEFEADDFAVEHADARALGAALVKLYRANASTLTPDPVHSAFYDTHPPAIQRIARLAAREA